MNRRRSVAAVALLAVSCLIAACSHDATTPAGDAGAKTSPAAPRVWHVSFIPDQNKAALEKIADKLVATLSQKTGDKWAYEPAADYQACVNGLAANTLDLVWLGGVTYVQAEEATKGQAALVVCRDIDLKFKSYFIANAAAVAAGKVKKVDKLADLLPQAKGLKMTFGAKDSTSGHVMPRFFLQQAGIDPEQAFAAAPQYSGNHNNTFTAVATGAVDLGVLNYTVYDGKKDEEKAQAPIVFTTEPFVAYCFVAHQRLGADRLGKLRAALTQLDAKQADDQAILAAFKAGSFVVADPKLWDGMRSVLKGPAGQLVK